VITGTIGADLPAGAYILIRPAGRIGGLMFDADPASTDASLAATGPDPDALPVPSGARVALTHRITGPHAALLLAGAATAAGTAAPPGLRLGFILFDPHRYPAVVDTPLFPVLMDALMQAVGRGAPPAAVIAVGEGIDLPAGTIATWQGGARLAGPVEAAAGIFRPREPGIYRHSAGPILGVNPPRCEPGVAAAGRRTLTPAAAVTPAAGRDLSLVCAGLALALYGLLVIVEP